MGYTKQIAYEKANDLGTTILELKTKEKLTSIYIRLGKIVKETIVN